MSSTDCVRARDLPSPTLDFEPLRNVEIILRDFLEPGRGEPPDRRDDCFFAWVLRVEPGREAVGTERTVWLRMVHFQAS
jgi:hypothetical protein